MSNRSLAETLFFVNLLFINHLSVRACSGVHDRVRGCFGGVRVMFGLCSGSEFIAIWCMCSKTEQSVPDMPCTPVVLLINKASVAAPLHYFTVMFGRAAPFLQYEAETYHKIPA